MSKRSVQITLLVLAVLAGAWIWWTLSVRSNDPEVDPEANSNMDVRQGYQQAAETLQAEAPWEYEALKAAEAALEAAQAAIPDDAVRPNPYLRGTGRDYYKNQSAWKAIDAALAALEKAKAAVALKTPQAYEAYESYYAALMALEKAKAVFRATRKFDLVDNTGPYLISDEVKAAKAVYQAANATYELLATLEGPLAVSLVNKDELKASYETLRASYFTLDAANEAYGVAWNEADETARKSGDIYASNAYKAYKAAKASFQAASKAYLGSLRKARPEYEELPWNRIVE